LKLRKVADEWQLGRGKGITINTVAPGPVITEGLPQEVPQVKALTDMLVSMTRAEERPGRVEDVADVVLFLASEKSRWLTGQWISASGGVTGN
jgi:NAD(P)-dependent dehydrogenase (short-subunit alcohol dehydrogenase family)